LLRLKKRKAQNEQMFSGLPYMRFGVTGRKCKNGNDCYVVADVTV